MDENLARGVEFEGAGLKGEAVAGDSGLLLGDFQKLALGLVVFVFGEPGGQAGEVLRIGGVFCGFVEDQSEIGLGVLVELRRGANAGLDGVINAFVFFAAGAVSGEGGDADAEVEFFKAVFLGGL
jgi:hypothetical protein